MKRPIPVIVISCSVFNIMFETTGLTGSNLTLIYYEYVDDLGGSFNLLGTYQTYVHDTGSDIQVQEATATLCVSSDPSSCIAG